MPSTCSKSEVLLLGKGVGAGNGGKGAGGPRFIEPRIFEQVERSGGLGEPRVDALTDLPEVAERAGVRLVFVWDEFEVALSRGAMDRMLLEEMRACAATGAMAFLTATNRDLRALCNPNEADLAFFHMLRALDTPDIPREDLKLGMEIQS